MDVRVNESGPRGAPQPNHLGAATRCSTRFWADGDDAAVERRHIGRTSCEQDRLDQRPYDFAMISFMISSVPAPILASRASRHALSTGNSRMQPSPPRVSIASPALSQAPVVASRLSGE